MPPKRKAAEAATERTTKTRRASAKEAPSKPTKTAGVVGKKGVKQDNTKTGAVATGLDPNSFSLEGVQALFDKYKDEDDSNIIGAEGMERLCMDALIPMDGALPLLVTWAVNAKTMGTITRTEFTDGFGKLRIDTPEKVALMATDLNSLFFSCSISEQASRLSIANKAQDADLYDRTQLRSYHRNSESAYSKFYSFCFALVKPPQSRNIDMETATAFWSVILAPKYPIAAELVAFITEKATYKAVTKDLWNMTLEFCKLVQTDLSGHDDDEAAWPSMLDDFIEWKKERITSQSNDTAMVE